jgi:hypothetical protein
VVLEAIRALRRKWARRDGSDHPFLSRHALLPTMASNGEWPVTYSASCELTVAVIYVITSAFAGSGGSD